MADASSITSEVSTASRSKQIGVCVVFLDDTLHQFQLTRRTLGSSLYAQVISRFRVAEPEYFDLEFYTAAGKQCWLERSKEVVGEWKKAIGERDKDSEHDKERREKAVSRKAGSGDLSAADPVFYFSVKYFVPDPTQLRAENTRYLCALQIRRDLRTGQLFCSENTAALLISYIVQGDYGDFTEDFYLRARPFIRSHYKNVNLSTAVSAMLTSAEFDALEQKIATYHRMHFGMSQSDADLCILDTARKIEFYGIRLYPVKDSDNIQLAICVVHFGVLIFQSRIKINSFNWSKIKKISYKKKKFVLKFRRSDAGDEEPRGQDGVLETIEFAFGSKEECRRFWQLVIDYHSFFRSHDARPLHASSASLAECDSLRKRAELLQTAASQAQLSTSTSFLANPALADPATLTQSMYVTPSTPSAYGFRPFGSLQRAALRRSMRQSMTPTPVVRGQPLVGPRQQPNGFVEHSQSAPSSAPATGLPTSAPVSRHPLAAAGSALPSRNNLPHAAPNGAAPPVQLARPASGVGGYASDTLESVRTGYTSASSGSHSLHDQRSARMSASDAYQRQFSVESAPVAMRNSAHLFGPSDAQSTGGSSLAAHSVQMLQPAQCNCANNPEYRPLDSSGYGSAVLQRASSAAICCPQCGIRAQQQSIVPAHAGRTPTNMRQPALSSGQLAAVHAAYEQQLRLSQGQLALGHPSHRSQSSRSSTPHSQQAAHQPPVPVAVAVGHYGPLQTQQQFPPGYYPGTGTGTGTGTGAYPMPMPPAAVRNSITSPPPQSALPDQLEANAPGASGRAADLSAYSQTVAVNTTVNGRRGSAASTSGVATNVNANANATPVAVNANGNAAGSNVVGSTMQVENVNGAARPPSLRQVSPALGVSAIEAQQETRLKSFQSFRQKQPAASPQNASPSYANTPVITNANQSDVRNSAALSMTISTTSTGSDSTIPESTITGSSNAAPGISSDAEAATPTLATAQSSTASTLTRSHQSSGRTSVGQAANSTSTLSPVLGAASQQLNGTSSSSATSSVATPTTASPPNGTVTRDAAAMRHIDSTTTTSPDDSRSTPTRWPLTCAASASSAGIGGASQLMGEADDVYTPLASLSSGYPMSPTRPAQSATAASRSTPPVSLTATQQATVSNDTQSYLALLAQDAVCQQRTYVKDLQILSVHLAAYVRQHAAQFASVERELAACTQVPKSSLAQLPDSVTLLDALVELVAPLYDQHALLLGELEAVNTASQTETQPPRSANAFLDVFVTNTRFDTELYRAYLMQIDQLVFEYFVRLVQTNAFDSLISKFEQDTKTCYLFVNDLLIKPLMHLHEYLQFLKKIENYVQLECTEQFAVDENMLIRLGELSDSVKQVLQDCGPRVERMLRYLGLLEIRKDVLLSYAPPLDRATFMRFGFLYKLSKKGYQQRMFFLFADFLLCANRTFLTSVVQFRARHCYTLADVQIASAGAPRPIPPDVQPSIGTHSFQLLITNSQQQQQPTRLLTLVANSETERAGWLTDLGKAIAMAKQRVFGRPPFASPADVESEEVKMLNLITGLSVSQSGDAARDDMRSAAPSATSPIATNSLVCVCWHRNNSLSASQFSSLLESQISGYLLRKFQNSNGWQRLWSVFSKCCLFFYKSYQDEAPIASLPLWGYTVALADESDQIQKAFVFKLTYKTHKYYFRTENELAFNRWMQMLRAALMNNIQV